MRRSLSLLRAPHPRTHGKLALAFQNVGRVRVRGQCDCGHEKHFYEPEETCDVTESGVRDTDDTTRES